MKYLNPHVKANKRNLIWKVGAFDFQEYIFLCAFGTDSPRGKQWIFPINIYLTKKCNKMAKQTILKEEHSETNLTKEICHNANITLIEWEISPVHAWACIHSIEIDLVCRLVSIFQTDGIWKLNYKFKISDCRQFISIRN